MKAPSRRHLIDRASSFLEKLRHLDRAGHELRDDEVEPGASLDHAGTLRFDAGPNDFLPSAHR